MIRSDQQRGLHLQPSLCLAQPLHMFKSHSFAPLSILLALFIVSCSDLGEPLSDVTSEHHARIERLIDNMTLEDKVGQMTQLTLGFLSTSEQQHDGKKKEVDWDKVRTAIETYRVGSILNSAGNAYPLEKWHNIVNGIQDLAMSQPLQIPVVYGIDAIHGVTYTQGSTLFPHNLGLAATRSS